MNQLLKFGLILGAICLAATLVLALTYEVTKPKIEEQFRTEEQAALKAIMPAADSFKERSLDGIEYFEAFKGENLIGYCVRAAGSGYSGYIKMIAGIDLNGVIQGVSVLEQSETPGLGAKIIEIKQGATEPWFLKQFRGKDARSVAIGKDIDAITGATISSRAVTNAIRVTIDDLLIKLKR